MTFKEAESLLWMLLTADAVILLTFFALFLHPLIKKIYRLEEMVAELTDEKDIRC